MSRSLFAELNYTSANEDHQLEASLLSHGTRSVLSVAGSGSRVIPLLAKHPSSVCVVDMSSPQLALTDLRLAALRQLDLDAYSGFLGYPPSPMTANDRQQIFEKLDLLPSSRRQLAPVFAASGWSSIVSLGRWERTFAKLSKLTRLFTGRAGERLLSCDSLAEQQTYLSAAFPWRRWRLLLRLFGQASSFNRLMYRGSFPKKNTPGRLDQFYADVFERLLQRCLFRDNLLLQVIFFGKILTRSACPLEVQPNWFQAAQDGLRHAKISLQRGSIYAVPASWEPVGGIQADEPFDFVSLSDTASYPQVMPTSGLLQALRPQLAPGATVVMRSYLHHPQDLDTGGFQETTSETSAPATEATGMYQCRVFATEPVAKRARKDVLHGAHRVSA